MPESFMPVAEASNLILDVGDWVIGAAAQALGRWQVAGESGRIAIRVSARQLERPDFFTKLKVSLARSSSPPWLLELELAESSAMQWTDAVVAGLAELRGMGISVAINGFGSGCSSLARIRDMPIDRVKLDRGLVAGIDSSDEARTIISAVTHLIHGLGCAAMAEGVERQEQVDVLRAVGCDAIQGYPCAAPMSEGAFLRWLRELDRGGGAALAQPNTARRIRA
jgi:EAL domain-containing protein (putative c-di-GMP-specific phosphodiesterase class I)